jgi:serine/threonine-protein kinase HipA
MELNNCTIQIFIENAWHDAAVLELTGDSAFGMKASTYLVYLQEHILKHWGKCDASALSVNMPVNLDSYALNSWPAFLIDLLPQGFGRIELLKQLRQDISAGSAADWALLCSGAGNPIGNLRIKEAHSWASERTSGFPRGFTLDEVASRAGEFNEYLAQHGLFLAGSSGVQGEWPKILLTRARDGLFYLDHTLADDQAEQHYIVKFGRGTDPSLANILRLEAPYMRLAKHLGLNVYAELILRERALFIPRFDRQIQDGKVIRFAQESIASLCEITGFSGLPSHNQICQKLSKVVTDPEKTVIEYIKRDIANIVLGNKDNHARNTAIQRSLNGYIGLTPLFDFAPMWLHPDGIARRIRWQSDDGGLPSWRSVIQQASEAADLDISTLKSGVQAMAAPMSTLLNYAKECGIEEEMLHPFEKTVKNVRAQLEDL